MKKLLLILLFIPLISFGQEKTVNLNVKNEKVKNNRGYSYIGNGIYSIKIPAVLWGSKSSVKKKLLKKVKEISSNLKANYNIINYNLEKTFAASDYRGGVATFELRDKIENNLLINKNEAKKEILELKEFLELGIITQEEFNTKVIGLKKILLGN
ncbi:hypothetical protein [Polaribacter sp. HL-MS24]|uniref:hypothetical protein n=1 Tax=Polaribacter sp. HL-MS24 TaxID=3077735 RepID=UPI0029351E08|nr:hypothetical protein [Polaribacter sp. HL-MS24]WOC41053.1 hypothetical protein RRF69_04655 [Polaribacter sp. HL-MS24]